MIDVRQWLDERTPPPPEEIRERLSSLVGNASVENEVALADTLVQHAVGLLDNLASDRSGAIELLVADALITYAMEAAASDHDQLERIADRAMLAIAQAGGSAST